MNDDEMIVWLVTAHGDALAAGNIELADELLARLDRLTLTDALDHLDPDVDLTDRLP